MLSKILDFVAFALKAKSAPETPKEVEITHPKLKQCYPRFAQNAQQFIDAAKKWAKAKRLDLDVHMALRTWEVQAGLYAIGRTKELGRKPVTRAKPGRSYHNYGLAIDIVFDGDISKQGIQWSWDDKYPWKELGELGKTFGLEWAGDWKSFTEMPHFQMTFDVPVTKLLEWHTQGGLPKVWEELDKVA